MNQIVPELHALQLTVPDPDLRFDPESGNWMIGPINWDEFWRVINGKGPCNQERMQARLAAHEAGAWVREALMEFSEKHAAGG